MGSQDESDRAGWWYCCTGYSKRLGRRGCCSFMKPRGKFKVWHGSLFVVVGVVATRGSRCIALSV